MEKINCYIILEVLKYINPCLSYRLVCKKWNDIYKNPLLWKYYHMNEYNYLPLNNLSYYESYNISLFLRKKFTLRYKLLDNVVNNQKTIRRFYLKDFLNFSCQSKCDYINVYTSNDNIMSYEGSRLLYTISSRLINNVNFIH